MKNCDIEDVWDEKNFFVILDSVQDPGNMGTIIRTADAAGNDRRHSIQRMCGCLQSRFKIHHGSIFHIPICQSQDIFEAMDRMKKEELRFVLPILKEVAIILILNTKIILQLLSERS